MGRRAKGKFIAKNNKQIRRAPKRSNKKVGNNKLSNVTQIGSTPIHVFERCTSVPMQIGVTGIIPNVGIVPFLNFSLWFTNQSAFIYGNSTNYITASVPGYSDLAALFDEVQIDSIDIEIYSTNLEATTLNGSTVMLLCSDFNDHIAPASTGDVLQYKDCKAVQLLSQYPYKEKVRPMMLGYTLDSAGTAVASNPVRGFIRSNLDIEHNCRKGSLLTVPNSAQAYHVLFRYKFKCRTVK